MAELAKPQAKAVSTTKSEKPRKLERGPGILTYIFLGIVVVLSAFPFYWMFVVASNDTSAMNSVPPAFVPGGNFLTHAQQVFDRTPFGNALINSAIVATATAITQTLFSAMAGFAFAKMSFPLRNTLFVIVVASMMVPLQLGVVPQFILISNLGLMNQLIAVILPGLVTAFGVFWMRMHIASAVPDEVLQAARVDGAGTFRTFWSVVLPMIRPAAAILALFAFLFAWNDFFWPLIVLQTPDSWTAQVALRQVQNQAYITDFGVQFAATVIATLPLLIISIIMGRQLVRGIMEGAVKG
jgi:cellobiose transport system permease protein